MEFFSHFWQQHIAFAMLSLLLIGFVAGFVDSIAGGGGLFSVTGFLFLGLPPTESLAQAKISSFAGTSVAFKNFLKGKKIIFKFILYGIPFALLGAYLGTKALMLIDKNVVGKVVACMMPFGILLFALPKNKSLEHKELGNLDYYFLIPLVCLCIGFYDGFFGPGTGSFLILAFHYILKMDLLTASANSKAFNLASNIGALYVFIVAKKVIWAIVIFPIAGNMLGNYIGSKLAISKGADLIKKILLVSLTCLYISLLIKYI
ncbi:MAG: hypothetical protein RLZZ210_55 [Pseudomonadota bacterium]|jgi:uncharacterized membrane protein YfcA